jgi:mRNA interferase MazF
MDKNFDRWNILKKNIHGFINNKDLFIKEGEVWMMNFGLNIGYEQDGSGKNFSRPGLIVKKFNRYMFWVIPLSTKQKNLDFYYNFKDPSGRLVSMIIAQIKLVSIKRLRRKLYEVPLRDLKNIKMKIKSFL